jgi:hypothetical protein
MNVTCGSFVLCNTAVVEDPSAVSNVITVKYIMCLIKAALNIQFSL